MTAQPQETDATDTTVNTAAAGETTLAMPEVFNIDTVPGFQKDVETALEAGETTLIVDAAGNEVITTPGVQSLLSLFYSTGQYGITLKIKNISEAMQESFGVLGLGDHLEIWSNSNG